MNKTTTLVFLIKEMNIGGAEKIVYYLIKHFAHKYKVVLISRPGIYSEEILKDTEIDFIDRRKNSFFKILFILRNLSKNDNLILHTHNRKDIVYSKLLKRPKHLHTFHSAYPNKNWLYKIIKPRFAISISYTVSDYLNYFKIKNKVIYNGVDLEMKTNRNKKIKQLKLLFIGRLSDEKGILEALEVISRNEEILFRIIGDGELLSRCKQIAYNRSNIEFIGYKITPWYYSNNFNAVIIPSKWEGFCLVAVEAVINGLPIISSDLPVLREILYFLPDKCFFTPGNKNEIARAIHYLENNYQEIFELIKNKQTEFHQKFSIREMCNNYNEIYCKL